ncbi:acyltransferase [Hymenobacter sp. RP-2-7]|uniref:Acyltransferase n=1 Tax=Hymenobacter polaris TaxID=2682546 RepID=A0A7Y0AHR0_9BACT|nr:acyltransferase [Hymenobacter polaris]NML67593.1 acyltransferase [Hymenobacter polaris]
MEPEIRKLPVRFYEIDLLRFLAALSVVFYHYTYRSYHQGNFSPVNYPALGPITKYGFLGVQLFFIISGYVVLMSAQGKTVRQFFISRVTRLYPAFWVACTLTFVVVRIWGPAPGSVGWSSSLDVSVREYALNMTMLHGFVGVEDLDSAYWSLTVEIGFYFLIAVLAGWRLFSYLPWVLAIWLAYCAFNGPAGNVDSPFFQLFFPKYAPYFIAGMVFYLLQTKAFRASVLYALLAGAYLLTLRSVRLDMVQGRTVFQDPDFSVGVGIAAVSGFFMIFWLLIKRYFDLSRYQWLSYCGALTYPLYLVHSSIGYVIYQHLGYSVNRYVLLAGLLTGLLLLAWTIHVAVEKRLAKPLGQRTNQLLDKLTNALAERKPIALPAAPGK